VHDDKPQNIEQAMWQEYRDLVAHRKWKAHFQPPQHFIIAVGSHKEPLHFSKVRAPELLHCVAESQIYPGKNVNRVAQRDWLQQVDQLVHGRLAVEQVGIANVNPGTHSSPLKSKAGRDRLRRRSHDCRRGSHNPPGPASRVKAITAPNNAISRLIL
jgi:hypothetical protein